MGQEPAVNWEILSNEGEGRILGWRGSSVLHGAKTNQSKVRGGGTDGVLLPKPATHHKLVTELQIAKYKGFLPLKPIPDVLISLRGSSEEGNMPCVYNSSLIFLRLSLYLSLNSHRNTKD